jgi:hypothetical protein
MYNDIESYVLATYYLTKRSIPIDIISFIIALTIKAEKELKITVARPPFDQTKFRKKETFYYIIDDDWIHKFGSQSDIISDILPQPIVETNDITKLFGSELIPFTSRKNLTYRPSSSRNYYSSASFKNIFFKPKYPRQNATDILLFFKYQMNRQAIPIFLFSAWVDITHPKPIDESILLREIKKHHLYVGPKDTGLNFYEHIRWDVSRIDKIRNENLKGQDINTGDIIIVSFSEKLDMNQVPQKIN